MAKSGSISERKLPVQVCMALVLNRPECPRDLQTWPVALHEQTVRTRSWTSPFQVIRSTVSGVLEAELAGRVGSNSRLQFPEPPGHWEEMEVFARLFPPFERFATYIPQMASRLIHPTVGHT